MDVTLAHDAELDIWTLTYVDVHLVNMQDVVKWRTALWKTLEKLGGRRVDLLIDLGQFRLEPAMANLYGPIAKEISDKHARCIIRFGALEAKTRAALDLVSKKLGYPLRVERDRDAGIRAIQHVRGERTRGSRPSIPDK